MEYTTLKNGVKMPLLGFGVFQVPEGEVCEESVYNALAVGYRLIDTAAVYGNEAAVGRAIRRWHLQRGVAAIPKSVHKERIEENINIFDFTLSTEDMAAIAALDTGAGLYGSTFNSPASAKMLRDIKIHD